MSVTVVLDLIHVLHYLWTIGLLLCGGAHKEVRQRDPREQSICRQVGPPR